MTFSPDALRDRVAIVTGAGQGIGRAIAVELAKVGAHVALCGRRLAGLEAAARAVRAHDRRAVVHICDVTDQAQVERAVAETAAEFGRIDLLVNNAGYNRHVLFKDHDVDDVERMMRVNYLSVVYWIKAVLPAMRAQGSGWIVNLSSVAGKLGQPDEAAYAATKFAVAGLSESISYEFDPLGIHVLCVHPALVRTEMFDEATMARLPASVQSSFISVEKFCAGVLDALARGAYEVTVPRHVGLGYLARLLAPSFFRKQIARLRLSVLPDLTS